MAAQVAWTKLKECKHKGCKTLTHDDYCVDHWHDHKEHITIDKD